MALYRVQAPNGKTYQIEGPAGAPQALIVQALLAQYPDAAKPPPETTVLGQVKEGFKGLIPGAVGLVESAAVGASALLPEDYEKTAREKISSIAGAAKAPFAASAGYEESVGRKLGEAIGSTVPFLAAGPLGLAGRLGAVGLGVGAGAGEARGRAEKEGATAEQRSTATALGVIPGAMEVFAPFRILSRIPDAATAQGVQLVKRALVAGGEEAAQEAASGFAQNLIAKGVYKPEQELIEGLGEQAAYGGATGAIVQGLMDLALGRRARAAQPAPGTLPGEAPVERAERLKAEAEAAKAAAQPAAAGILPPPDTYAELVLYSEQLKTLPKSKERDEALKLAAEKRKALNVAYIEGQRSASEAAKQFMTAEEAAAAAITPREEVTAAPEGQAPAAPVEEPKVRKVGEPLPLPDVLDSATVKAIGFPRGGIHDILVGKSITDPEVRTVLEEYKQRPNASAKTAAKIDAFIARLPESEAPTPPVQPETPSVAEPQPEAGGAGVPVAGGPAAASTAEGVGPEPDGVVSPVTDVAGAAGREGTEPPAVTPPTPAQVERELATLVESGRITEEQAADYRAELLGEAEEAPTTAMEQAFQKQVDDIKAQMNALKRNKRRPAKKTPAGNKYDELEAQLQTLVPKATGNLAERIELLGLSSVIGKAPYPGAAQESSQVTLDIGLLKENLTKAKASPRMTQAILSYIGVDADGNYLPTVYSREEAAEMAGLSRATGSEVSRAAEAMGITLDVRSRFHAGQTGAIGIAKNVSEAGTGATDLQPTRGVLYEAPKKNQPVTVAKFLRGALTPDGKLDFTGLDNKQIAEIYARASNYDPKRGGNIEVIKKLNEEIAARTEADRKGMQSALDRAYRVVRTEEETAAERAEIDRVAEEGVEAEEVEADDQTRRLSDEDTDFQQTRTGPVDLENSKQMDDALRGKSFTESIDYAIRNARDDLDRQILVKVKRRAEELANNGVEFSFSLTAPGRVLRGALGLATTTSAGLGDATTVDVKLNGFTNDPSDTLSQETLAHELVHAVTVAQITYAPQSSAAIKLRALQQELVGIYNQRYKAGTLTATEKGVILNALENPKELLAYGLTNGETQNWLASITDPSGGTFLSRMFNIVSQVLGLKGKETSALARLMAVSEEILDESLAPYIAEANRQGLSFGKQANTTGFPSWVLKEAQGLKPVWHKGSVALYEGTSTADTTIYVAAKQGAGRTHVDIRGYPGAGFTPAELAELRQAADNLTPQASPRLAPQTEAAVQGVNVIGEKERQTLTQRIAQDLKGNPALKLRMKFTDSLAPLEDFFVNAYSGATRTAKGRLNPMVLLSRALDSLRVSKAVQEQGGLGFDSGLIVAKDLKNAEGKPVSYTGVLNRIAEAAKQRGETYEAFRTKVDTVLYGHREHGLRETNKTLPKTDRIELLLPDAKIDELEAAFQKDDFIKQVSADLDTIRFNLLDTLVDTGRISKDRAQDYKDATGYIPFNRLGDYEKVYQSTKGANRGVAALRNIRKLEGSTRQTASPVENFSGLVDWATKEAMKNHAALSALKDMALMGAAFKRPTKPKTDSPGDMVTVYDNGKPVEYYVPDPAHFIAFSIQDPVIPDSFKLLQKGSQILRAGVTSMPPFAIKQVFDDIVRAYTYAGVKNNAALVKSVMLNFPKNWVNEIFQKKPKDIKNLEALGIVGTFDFSQQGNLENILEEAGAKEEGLGSKIMRVMEAGAKASDLAVRQAVYDQVMKETNGDKAQAESAAREVINFSRRGSSKTMNLLISIIPFFNAYARGMDKLATAAAGGVVGQSTGTARSMFYKRMGVMTSMGLLYALLMQDDEEYQQLPDHVRDTNWILPHGKELGFVPAIPIPAELAFFFKAIPERIVRYYKLYGTEEEQTALNVVGNMTKRGIDVFSSPNITAQMIRPFLENMVNHSFFLDRPLESQAKQALRPFERYGTGTSDAMKSLAKSMEDVANATGVEAFAISPIKLENVVRGIFGTAAGLGLSMADMMINPGRTDRPLNQQLGAQLTGLSAVTKDPIGTRQLDFIYDLEKRVEQVNGTVNRLMERKPEDVDQFIQDNIGLYSIRGPVQGVMGNIRALNQAAMILDRDTSLSPEERRKRIDELRVDQNKLAQQAQMLRKMARDIQMGR
jgi:polyhydroxyalkanoate synthesis regulator phasin